VNDPTVKALRQRVNARPDDAIAREGARVRIRLSDGTTREEIVEQAIGSLYRPMTNAQLEAKFRTQARPHMEDERKLDDLVDVCWRINTLPEARTLIEQTSAQSA